MYTQYRGGAAKADTLVTVFGATGQQGGSVARALLAGGTYRVRAVTRNPDCEAAKKLQEMGAEVVKADYNDRESLLMAVTGAYGCFAVTNFFETMSKAKEAEQGINIADACKQAGVKHLIYNGAENVKKMIGLDVGHYDGKAEVEEYLQSNGIPFTSVRIAAYTENFLSYFLPQKIGEKKYALFLPIGDLKCPFITCADVGECVQQIFNCKDEFLGKCVGLASYELSVAEMADILSEHLGKDIVDGKITTEAYAKLGFPGAEDLANMFTFHCSGKCNRDISTTTRLNPKTTDLRAWLIANKDTMLAAFKE